MVLDFTKQLQQALQEIDVVAQHGIPIHLQEEERRQHDEFLEIYGKAKWKIVDLINAHHATSFCLSHWLEEKEDDVAYFLNEVGSNSLNHTQFKAPSRFLLWLGNRGFIIGIEQKGEGFNALQINQQRIKQHAGGAFTFFRDCQSVIFFDNPCDARVIYLKHDVP